MLFIVLLAGLRLCINTENKIIDYLCVLHSVLDLLVTDIKSENLEIGYKLCLTW